MHAEASLLLLDRIFMVFDELVQIIYQIYTAFKWAALCPNIPRFDHHYHYAARSRARALSLLSPSLFTPVRIRSLKSMRYLASTPLIEAFLAAPCHYAARHTTCTFQSHSS